MKKIILLLSLSFLLFSCEKEEIKPSHEFDYVYIELYGSITVNFNWISGYDFETIESDTLNYSIIYDVNGIQNQVEINKIIDAPFTGIIYLHRIKLFINDDFNITIINNKPNRSYVYANVYTNQNRKVKINTDTFFQSNIKVQDNYFRDILLY